MAETQRAMTDITVAIAVKDRPDDLKIAVASVANQTVLPRELLIVDDFSATPVTPDLFGDLGGIDLRILRNAPNRGAAASYNRSVREARCPVVAFLDSDDCFMPDYIAVVSAEWAKRTARPACVAAGLRWCTNELAPYRTQIVSEPVTRDNLLRRGNFVGGCSVLSVDRDTFLSVGGYPDVRGAYDWGLMLRLIRAGTIETIRTPLVLYRSPSTSLLANDTKNFRRQILSVCAILREQPPEDRRKAHPFLLKSICYNLAQAGRGRLCWKLIPGLVRQYGLDAMAGHIIVATLIGPRRYFEILRRWAYFRAKAAFVTPPGHSS